MEMDCTYRDKPSEKPYTFKERKKEKGPNVHKSFHLLWYLASTTQHFVKQFVSLFFHLPPPPLKVMNIFAKLTENARLQI